MNMRKDMGRKVDNSIREDMDSDIFKALLKAVEARGPGNGAPLDKPTLALPFRELSEADKKLLESK